MRLKSHVYLLLHFLFLIAVIAGITLLHFNSNFGKGLGWLKADSYESSNTFTAQLEEDISSIFTYVRYRNVFETDGAVDSSKEMISVVVSQTETVVYTLDDLIRYARANGYYLNDSFQITGSPVEDTTNSDSKAYYVEWKAYNPDQKYSEPGDAYQTLDQLSYEVLEILGRYYTAYYKLMVNPTNLHFIVDYSAGDGNDGLYTNSPDMTVNQIKSMGKYVFLSSDSVIIENNLTHVPKNLASEIEISNTFFDSSYYAAIALDTSYPYDDIYKSEASLYHTVYRQYLAGVIFLAIGILGCMITLYCLVRMSKNSILYIIDKLSVEGELLFFAFIFAALYFIFKYLGIPTLQHVINRNYWNYTTVLVNTCILYIIVFILLLSFSRRIYLNFGSNRILIREWCSKLNSYFTRNTFSLRLTVLYISFSLINIILAAAALYFGFMYNNKTGHIICGICIFFLAAIDIIAYYNLFKQTSQQQMISQAIENIANGQTDYKVDLNKFSSKELQMAENMNNISTGLEQALNEKVKSERLKADLITNVSHDIKTPLTSIINYVDLMKREKPENEKINEYLDILDQKSQRLKTLTEDLVEASKASSGNLTLEMSDINMVELIQQTTGEFEDKFLIRHLELVSELPEHDIIIRADGRRLWRVLENLYNNAFKYAMENTRVYASVTEKDDLAVFTIKNVSSSPLNIAPDELTERFVRGDVSRSTEGSGLGLSIAKSLTALQGGIFEIVIDGDLFKASVSFTKSSSHI